MHVPESPLETFFRRPRARHVNGQEKLDEVNVAVAVFVKGTEDVVAKGLGIARWEEHPVHFDKGLCGESARGAVLKESSVPIANCGLVKSSE